MLSGADDDEFLLCSLRLLRYAVLLAIYEIVRLSHLLVGIKVILAGSAYFVSGYIGTANGESAFFVETELISVIR